MVRVCVKEAFLRFLSFHHSFDEVNNYSYISKTSLFFSTSLFITLYCRREIPEFGEMKLLKKGMLQLLLFKGKLPLTTLLMTSQKSLSDMEQLRVSVPA